MKTTELRLFEFAPTRTVFSQLLADPTIHMGFECEMVTDVEESGLRDTPPDYDRMSWSEVEQSDYVEISQRQRDRIADEYYEWLSDRATRWLDNEWSDQEDEYTLKWCIENGHLESKDDENADDVVDQYRNDARDEFFEENREHAEAQTEGDMDDFISSEFRGLNTRLMSNFDINYMGYDDEDSETDVSGVYDDMARDLRDVVGKDVSTYAYSKNSEDWYIEADGSLQGDGYVCAEVVSSVYQLSEGLDALNTIFEWMEERDYSTNASTGLHVSFSIEDKDENDFDFLKMMILFDENYTANLFNRLNAYFAAQMRKVVFADMAGKGDLMATLSERQIQDVIAKLRKITAKAFKGGAIGAQKYYSFRHRADGVVEFRSMGGRDYEKKFDVIRKRIVNMAYLMKVGCDPMMMAREYIGRVYKMLTSTKYQDPRLGSGAARVEAPFAVSSFQAVFDREPELATHAVKSPYQFLASVGVRIRDHSINLTPMQLRQLRFYAAKHKISAEMFRNFFPNSDPLYNTIANLMRWPLVVPGDHDPHQQVLPFTRRGVDRSGSTPEPGDPYEPRITDQGEMYDLRGDHSNRLHD